MPVHFRRGRDVSTHGDANKGTDKNVQTNHGATVRMFAICKILLRLSRMSEDMYIP